MGQHALVHQLHLAHVMVRVGHEAEAVKKEQQETWVEMEIIDRAQGRQSHHFDYSYKVACPPNTVRTDKVVANMNDTHLMSTSAQPPVVGHPNRFLVRNTC